MYIKHRESFRKFAASVPEEVAAQYFDVGSNAQISGDRGRMRPISASSFQRRSSEEI